MNESPLLLALLAAICLTGVSGCEFGTDAATRLAYDLESGAGRLAAEGGATFSVRHATPSKAGECTGPYKVQFDKVGAIIIWCYDDSGETVSSHSTSYHSRFVDTPRTMIVDMTAGSTLIIDLKRRGGRAVIVDVSQQEDPL